jgi:RNA polymerase sigma-70 factor (ECF subfamily)
MSPPATTCWTIIRGAAAGGAEDRDRFARRYAPVVRAYLAARWRSGVLLAEIDDGVQEVFVECFRAGGVLENADADRAGGFRPFFYGMVRNVALRIETRRARAREQQSPSGVDLEAVATSEEGLSRVFDRAWAKAILREAGEAQAERAQQAGEAATRRLELLRLRFHEGLPIREIARRWNADAAALHHEYARAREEFRAALVEVVAFHRPGSPAEVERECSELLALLA